MWSAERIQEALAFDNLEVLKEEWLLKRYGYDVSMSEKAVRDAVNLHSPRILKWLLEKYPDHVQILERMDPLIVAIELEDNARIIELLPGHYKAEYPNRDRVLHGLLEHGMMDMLELLLKLDAVCYKEGNGKRLWLCACRKGKLEAVKWLAENVPGSLKLKRKPEENPMIFALERQDEEIVRILMDTCPDMRKGASKTKNGFFHAACRTGNLNLVKYILEIDPDAAMVLAEKWRYGIHYAAEKGHIEVLKYILERYPGQERVVDGTGRRILHCAADNGHTELVKYILKEFPAEASVVDSNGRNFIFCALENRHKELVDFALEMWPQSMTFSDDYGRHFIHFACKAGMGDVVSQVIEKYPEEFRPVHGFGVRLIHYACYGGLFDVVKKLIELDNSEGTAADIHEAHPIHCACVSGHLEIIKFLLERYPTEISATDSYMYRPFNYLCEKGHLDAVKYVLGKFPREAITAGTGRMHPVHIACMNGHLNIVNYIITQVPKEAAAVAPRTFHERWMDFEEELIRTDHARITGGKHLVHIACELGYQGLVRQIIGAYKAEAKAVDGKQISLLAYAEHAGMTDLALYIIGKYPTEILEKTPGKKSVLCEAAKNNRFKIISKALASLPNFDITMNRGGERLIHYACLYGHLDVVKHIATHAPAELSRPGADGDMPIMYACRGGSVDVVEFLWTKDPLCIVTETVSARTQYMSVYKRTAQRPIHAAIRAGRVEIVKFIAEKYPNEITGVDNWKGVSALQLAAESDSVPTVEYIISKSSLEACIMCERFGRSPFAQACESGSRNVVRYLRSKLSSEQLVKAMQGYGFVEHACRGKMFDIAMEGLEVLPDSYKELDAEMTLMFHAAIDSGTYEVGKKILEIMPDIAADPNPDDEPLLARAYYGGNIDLVKYMLTEFPDLNKHYEDFFDDEATSLEFAACERGDLELVKFLHEKFPKHFLRQPWFLISTYPIEGACQNNHIAVVEYLIDVMPVLLERYNFHGRPIVQWACVNGHSDLVNKLIDKSSDSAIAADTAGNHLILYACEASNLDIVNRILSLYPNEATATDSNGNHLIHYAFHSRCFGLMERILTNYPGEAAAKDYNGTHLIQYACTLSCPVLMNRILSLDSNALKAIDNNQKTLLHYAAEGGFLDLVKRLLTDRNQLEQTDFKGQQSTAVNPSVYMVSNSPILKVKFGVLMGSVGSSKAVLHCRGCTPLAYAQKNEHKAVSDYILMQMQTLPVSSSTQSRTDPSQLTGTAAKPKHRKRNDLGVSVLRIEFKEKKPRGPWIVPKSYFD